MPRPLAAGIEIFKVLLLYCILGLFKRQRDILKPFR